MYSANQEGRKSISLFYFLSVRLIITAYDVAKTNIYVLWFVKISTPQQVLLCKQCWLLSWRAKHIWNPFIFGPVMTRCSRQMQGSTGKRLFRLIPKEAISQVNMSISYVSVYCQITWKMNSRICWQPNHKSTHAHRWTWFPCITQNIRKSHFYYYLVSQHFNRKVALKVEIMKSETWGDYQVWMKSAISLIL